MSDELVAALQVRVVLKRKSAKTKVRGRILRVRNVEKTRAELKMYYENRVLRG